MCVLRHAACWMVVLMPAAATIAADSSGCNSDVMSHRVGGASIVRSLDTSVQQKNWQPQGGEIQFTIKSNDQIPPDASLLLCFRWKDDVDKDEPFMETQPLSFERSSDGKTLTLVTAVPRLGKKPSHLAHTAVGIVPLADVRILALDSSGAVKADVMTSMGITYVGRAAFIVIVTLLVALGGLWQITRKRLGLGKVHWRTAPLYLISTPAGVASLSQLQIFLWIFVVGASATYVMALSGDLIQVTTGTLVLLGISGTATLGAKLDGARKDSAGEAAATPSPPVDPAPPARQQQGLPREPRWSDLVATESVKNGQLQTEIDVSRVQLLYFTLITAAFVVLRVLTTYVIPEIPDGFQILMGISNGVYLGSKAVPSRN